MALKILKTLKIPSETDVIHTWPEINKWQSIYQKNVGLSKRINYKNQKSEIIQKAIDYTKTVFNEEYQADINLSVTGTGHQPSWHHCGILAKDILAEAFSRSMSITNLHVVLDHDIQDSTIKTPWTYNSIHKQDNFADNTPLPFEFKRFEQDFGLTNYPNDAICRKWHDDCHFSIASQFNNMADAITYLQGTLKARLGIKPIYLPVSEMCQTTAFKGFVIDILNEYEKFTLIYNNAIKVVSRKNRNINKSIKTLVKEHERLTLPFWLTSQKGERYDLCIKVIKNKKLIYAQEKLVCEYKDDSSVFNEIKSEGYNLRPKAITLMLFLRIYVFDWFIHGVGGGKYAPITNHILKHYYGIEEKSYGTATLTLPLIDRTDYLNKTNEEIKYLADQIRKMRYNPENFLSCDFQPKSLKILIESKKEAISNIKTCESSKDQKACWFNEIAQVNSKLLYYINEEYQNTLKKFEDEKSKKQQFEVENRRDYFFGLFSEERLKMIIKRTFEDECFKKPKT